ncbi:low-density lipoprotein receptor-related protein 3 [Tachyglossus aculeatus]|uniref:low-density lipoprotein receptor-related protein 3 n=1 Tax=Tachyglossus aculeatus TaxID=9261 RepID=UPI0018F2C611|nr:low-density lipoprotein receptor-related protein 3 [Tachyglossus aculeatus]
MQQPPGPAARLAVACLVNLFLTGKLGSAVPSLAACSGKLEQHTERRGVIYSPAWPLNYPPATNCSWYIQGDHGDIITISFKNFDLEDSHKCSLDWLMIGPSARREDYRVCGSTVPPVFISSRDHVWIFFHSDASSSGQAQGFRLSYIRGKTGQSVCQTDEFHCTNGKCVPSPWRCNSVDECGDESDERNCTAPPTEQPPSLCPTGTFPCPAALSTTRCLPLERRCDAARDCGDGSDELGCPDLSCGKHLGNFYGSFASPDLFRGDHSQADLHCTWYVNTQDTRHVLLQLDLQLGYSDYVQVFDGLGEQGDRLVKTLSYRSNRRPVSVEAPRGQLTVVYHARAKSTGHGFNATYQVKGYCLPWERPCGSDEGCFAERQRCDGWWHCPGGKDEEGCPACRKGEYPCEGNSGLCYALPDRCNNQKNCPDGSDEKNCFSCQPGNFHCGTNLCIFETWRCDGQEDCQDGSDEHNCLVVVPRKVITAALIGSLVCGLLLVIALGCAFKLYSLRTREYRAFETQMTRLEAEFVRREAPPSYGQLIAQGLIPPVEDFPLYNASQVSVLQNIRSAMRRQMRQHSSRRSSSRRRLGRLWNRFFHRPRARGQIPLLTPARPSQTILGDGIIQQTDGGRPSPPASPEGCGPEEEADAQAGGPPQSPGSALPPPDTTSLEPSPSDAPVVTCTASGLEPGHADKFSGPGEGPRSELRPVSKGEPGKTFRDPLSDSMTEMLRDGRGPTPRRIVGGSGSSLRCAPLSGEGPDRRPSQKWEPAHTDRPPNVSLPPEGLPPCCPPSCQEEPLGIHTACCHTVQVLMPQAPSPLSDPNTSDDESLLVC